MKDKDEKKFVVIPFFGANKFHKIELFYFEMLKKKIWAIFKRIVIKLSKIWVWDPGFGIPDPGVKKAPDLRPPDLDPQQRLIVPSGVLQATLSQ